MADHRLHAGERVVVTAVPPGLLDNLPDEDQRAILAIVGKPLTLVGYDDDGRAELHFADPFDGQSTEVSDTHSIWVAPEFIAAVR